MKLRIVNMSKICTNIGKGLALSAMLTLVACSGEGRPFEEAVETNQLNLQALSIDAPGGFAANTALFVSPGQQISFAIVGTNTSNESVSLSSDDRRWSVDQPAFASIDENGNFTAIANGTVVVGLQIGGLRTETPVTVSQAELVSFNQIIGPDSLERCIPQNYNATGDFDDGSTRGLLGVGWSIADPNFGFTGVADQGEVPVTAVNAGALELVATIGSVVSSKSIVVEDNLEGIDIEPTNIELRENDTENLVARGNYLRGEDDTLVRPTITDDVSWSLTSDARTDIASVSNIGLITALEVGSTSVTVACGNVSAQKDITVSEGESTDDTNIAFENGSSQTVSLSNSSSVLLRASRGDVYSAASDAEDQETWSVLTPPVQGVATAVFDSPNSGLIRLLASGTVIIRVTIGNDTADLTLTILP